MSSRTIPLALAVAAALLLPCPARAHVYHWEDEDGTVHFTNAPDRVPGPHRPEGASLPPPALEPPSPDEPAPSREGPRREEPIAIARALTRIPFSPGTPIMVSARISDSAESVHLILDTGADRTVVAPQALGRLGISTLNAPQAMIHGVTGSGQAGVVQVSSVQVGEARVGPLRIVAHDVALAQADGLLGRDFLEQFTVTIDAVAQTVTLSSR
jgi:hypothetical protein